MEENQQQIANRKNRKTVFIVAIIGLAALLAIWLIMGTARADCISASTLALVATTMNATNNTVNLTPLLADITSLCQRVDNITANLNGNATLLLTTNATLYSLMKNISVPTTNFTISNYSYQLITPDTSNISSLTARVGLTESSITGLGSSINSINSNVANIQNSVNSLSTGKVDTAAINSVNARVDSLNTSLNTTKTDVTALQSKKSTVYAWVGIILVGLLAIGLKFL
jgi:tetrahydromethanopterin S-methyltransferase subunit B